MELIFEVQETQGNTVFDMDIEEYLEEINRDRLCDWVEITKKDITKKNNYHKELFEDARYFFLLTVKTIKN